MRGREEGKWKDLGVELGVFRRLTGKDQQRIAFLKTNGADLSEHLRDLTSPSICAISGITVDS